MTWFIGLGVSVAGFPFASDDYVHLAAAAGWDSPLAVFDPALVPLRPLQHLWFWWVERLAHDAPWLARAPIVFLHLGSVLLLVRLARQAGVPLGRLWVVAVLVAVFPSVANLTWVAAVGWPLRHFFVLLAVTSYIAWWRSHDWRHIPAVILGLLGGLAAHQGAFLLPAWCAAWLVLIESREQSFRWRRALTEPVLLTLSALVVGYVLYVGMLRPERHHGMQSLATVVTNGTKALWSLAPSWLRVPAIAALRGDGWQLSIGVATSAAWLAVLSAGLFRSRLGLFLLVVIGLELAVTVISVSGFGSRYSYIVGALLAVGMAAWAASGSRFGCIIAAVLAISWCFDSVDQAREHRAVAVVLQQLQDDVVSAAATRDPAEPIVFIDVPASLGAEREVSAFRWGFPQALEAWGVQQPWQMWRTDRTWSAAQGELVEPEDLPARMQAVTRGLVLRFDTSLQRLVIERGLK